MSFQLKRQSGKSSYKKHYNIDCIQSAQFFSSSSRADRCRLPPSFEISDLIWLSRSSITWKCIVSQKRSQNWLDPQKSNLMGTSKAISTINLALNTDSPALCRRMNQACQGCWCSTSWLQCHLFFDARCSSRSCLLDAFWI